MNLAVQKVVEYLKENDKTEEASVLQLMPTELVNVKETFQLGRVLQKLLDYETNFSNTCGINVDEILEVIEYVEQNMKQAKY